MRVDGVRFEGAGGLEGMVLACWYSDETSLDGLLFWRETYHKGIQNANGYPERAPHGIDDGDERVSRLKPFDAGDELRQT